MVDYRNINVNIDISVILALICTASLIFYIGRIESRLETKIERISTQVTQQSSK